MLKVENFLVIRVIRKNNNFVQWCLLASGHMVKT